MSIRSGRPERTTRPLVAARLLALDCETTGLDISKDRLIQLGGVRIRGGQVAPEERFESMVNPEVDIPPASPALDAGRYRLRVADRMAGVPEVMPANQTIGKALAHMMARGVSSVFLGDGGDGPVRPETSGIVTERDILRAIDRLGGESLQLPLESFATRPGLVGARAGFPESSGTRG